MWIVCRSIMARPIGKPRLKAVPSCSGMAPDHNGDQLRRVHRRRDRFLSIVASHSRAAFSATTSNTG